MWMRPRAKRGAETERREREGGRNGGLLRRRLVLQPPPRAGQDDERRDVDVRTGKKPRSQRRALGSQGRQRTRFLAVGGWDNTKGLQPKTLEE